MKNVSNEMNYIINNQLTDTTHFQRSSLNLLYSNNVYTMNNTKIISINDYKDMCITELS